MSDEPSDSPPEPDRSPAERVDARQLAFVGLALLALVVAAFLAPTVAIPGDDASDPVDRSGGEPREPEQRDGPTFEWLEWLSWLLPEFEEPADPRCTVLLSQEPRPGEELTVTVHLRDAPLADAPVWFDDRHVGRTDDDGRVTGEVPYVRELSIRVGVEGAPDCLARTDRIGASTSAVTDPIRAISPVGLAAAQSENSSVSVDVDGEMALDVDGDPYPGEVLQVRATIDDRPVPDAEVTVDGETVARTDDDGAATVTVPDDGREEVTVRATRGEFAAEETFEVLLLAATLESPHLAVVPGADATVVASFADRSAEGAAVTVDGERVGNTDAAGHLAVALPSDPTATVRVEARGQTSTTSVVDHYLVPAVLLGLLVAVAAGAAYWRRDARAAAAVLGGAAGLLAVVVAVVLVDALVGATARNALLAVLCAVVVGVGLFARRDALADGAETSAGLLARAVARLRALVAAVRGRSPGALLASLRERLLGAALRLATAIGAAVDELQGYARRLLERVRSLPRSVSGVLTVAVRRVRTAVTSVVETARTRPRLAVALVAGGVAIAAGYVLEGRRGFAVATAGVVVAWLLARRFRGEATEEPSTAPPERAGAVPLGPQPSNGGDDPERSFRELWRAFARTVVPGSWRTSTPEEVARAAVEQGYPRGPVEELTALFREVEYGGRPLSTAVRDRAADAYERLRGGGEEP